MAKFFPGKLLADIRPLQESPAFRRLWIGQGLSQVGSQMTLVAVPVQVYALTGSSVAVGMIGLAIAIPMLTIGLLGGSLADAFDRRKLVLVTTVLLSIVSGLFAVQAFLGSQQLWLLYVLVTIQSCLLAISLPASRTIMPRLLPPERFAAASALTMLSFQVSLVVGPLIAGVLIATAGAGTAYLIDALTFLPALVAILKLPPLPTAAAGATVGLKAVAEGLRFVRRQRVIRGTLLADLAGTSLAMPHALFPALAATQFGGGPEVVGMLYAGSAIGGLFMGLFSGPLSHIRRHGLAVLLSVAVWGAALAGLGFTRQLWLAMLLLSIAGAADVVNAALRNAIVQTNTPDALRGRINSVNFVVGVGGPRLGDVRAGLVAGATSPAASAASGGIACVVVAGLVALWMPALVRYDASGQRQPPDEQPQSRAGDEQPTSP